MKSRFFTLMLSALLMSLYVANLGCSPASTPNNSTDNQSDLASTSNREMADSNDQADGDADDLVSIVLLLRNPKPITDVELAELAESAWGGDFTSGDDDADGFVVGEGKLLMIKSPLGMFTFNNFDRPYWQDVDSLAEEVKELRLRKALASHEAWLSIDLTALGNNDVESSIAYQHIAKLIVKLADEDTLAVYRPGMKRFNVWSDEVAEKMAADFENVNEVSNVAVVAIENDHPLMVAAIEKAKEQWPKFAKAFNERENDAEGDYVVKAKISTSTNTEYIWVNVTELSADNIKGKLANDPVDLGDLKIGSEVDVPLSDMQDWCYLEGDKPIGLFSLYAIQKIQAENKD